MNQYDVSGVLRTYSEKAARATSTAKLRSLLRELSNELDLRTVFYEDEDGRRTRKVAYDIQWDTDDGCDDESEPIELPSEICIPAGMVDTEEISDYISEFTGFCHFGFSLKTVPL